MLKKSLGSSVLVVTLALTGASAMAASPKPRNATSVYTSLNNCEIINESTENDEIDFFTEKCESIPGYIVHIEGGDARSWVEIRESNTQAPEYSYLAWQAFNAAQVLMPFVSGSKLEWRGTQDNKGKFTPYAFIYRMTGQSIEDELTQEQKLIVGKINGTEVCVIGAVNASGNPTANVEARVMADDVARTSRCPDIEI